MTIRNGVLASRAIDALNAERGPRTPSVALPTPLTDQPLESSDSGGSHLFVILRQ